MTKIHTLWTLRELCLRTVYGQRARPTESYPLVIVEGVNRALAALDDRDETSILLSSDPSLLDVGVSEIPSLRFDPEFLCSVAETCCVPLCEKYVTADNAFLCSPVLARADDHDVLEHFVSHGKTSEKLLLHLGAEGRTGSFIKVFEAHNNNNTNDTGSLRSLCTVASAKGNTKLLRYLKPFVDGNSGPLT